MGIRLPGLMHDEQPMDDSRDHEQLRRARAASLWHVIVSAFARMLSRISRISGFGAGETAPGRIAHRLAPSLGSALARRLPLGAVIVSGTNGKTTTASMIEAIARRSGVSVVSSRSGANMASGVVSSLLQARGAQLGVFEVDEGALPAVVAMVRPRALVLTNIFRDQLDRFGEPEKVAELFRQSIARLDADAIVVANGDDPALTVLGHRGKTTYYGAEVPAGVVPRIGGEPEVCPVCGAALRAVNRTLAHLGAFSCPACGWRTPERMVVVRVGERTGLGPLTVHVGEKEIGLPLGGLYNAYNAAAALAASEALGFSQPTTHDALTSFRPRFGRQERFELDGATVLLMLAKNPAGTNAILEDLGPDASAVVVALNDRAADGRDVSWIWDADYELLAPLGVPIFAAGTRAEELAVRLAYAGCEPEAVHAEPAGAVRAAGRRAPAGTVAVLATYTAMLDLRRSLTGTRAASVLDRRGG
jgi:lipid II isoglutaminyl synthase (glutamine-hydrolysing)